MLGNFANLRFNFTARFYRSNGLKRRFRFGVTNR
jgi:hypothetical protein